MDIQREEDDFNAWFNKQTINAVPDADLSLQRLWASLAWQAAKAQAVPDGFALVSQKDLLELTIAINAVDLATHTESKTNEVREMWQQVAIKLMALGTTQEPK